MENIENKYNQALSSFIYQRCLIRDCSYIAIVDAIVMSTSLIIANAILLWINNIPFSIINGWLIVPAWFVFSLISKLMPGWGLGSADELRKVQRTLFVFFASMLIVSFLSRSDITSSRIVFLFTYLLAAVLLPLLRFSIRNLLSKKKLWGVPVSIYGGKDKIEDIIRLLRSDLALGYLPSAIYSNDFKNKSSILDIPIRGNMSCSNSTTPIGLIVQGSVSDDEFNSFICGPGENYRKVIILPELLAAPSLWVSPIDFEGILGLEVTKNLLNPLARIGKMMTDYILILITLPIWLSLVIILFFLILLEDGKNPFFLQKRIGKSGKSFSTIKFRTMVPNAEEKLQAALKADKALESEWNTHFKLKKDPRITKIGNVLRRTSLDELPQFFNILNGTMSLVGPRPLPLYHFEDLPKSVQQLRHQVKPGVTGLWQVSGRSESGTIGMEKWDPYYVRNWSIWLDLLIIFRTIKAVICAKGAY